MDRTYYYDIAVIFANPHPMGIKADRVPGDDNHLILIFN